MNILKILSRRPSETGGEDNTVKHVLEDGITVLGSGCSRCRRLYENTRRAASRARPGIKVGYCTDPAEAAHLGIISMPALLCGEQILSTGKVLTEDEIARLLGAEGRG